MESKAFFSPEDVKFIDQCFANRNALEAILEAKSVNLRVSKNGHGKIMEIYSEKPERVTHYSIWGLTKPVKSVELK